MMTNVTIVIPTCNRPGMVKNAVLSAINQTYPPYEILIGDDSVDDLTAVVMSELQDRTPITIRYIKNNPRKGQAKNMNMLFDQAAGDKLLLLHDDDELLPTALETLLACFDNNPGISIAYGKQYIMTDAGVVSESRSKIYNDSYYRSKSYEGLALTPIEAGIGQQFPNNSYLINTEIVKKIQFRSHDDDFKELGNGCEYDFGVQLGLNGYAMYFVDKHVAKYRVSDTSMSKSKKDDSGYQAFRILANLPVTTETAEKIKSSRLLERAPIAITQAVNTGKRKEALRIFFGPWYRSQALSLGGIKRILYILFYWSPGSGTQRKKERMKKLTANQSLKSENKSSQPGKMNTTNKETSATI